MRKRGEILSIPQNTQIVAYEDLVTNFPLILHRGQTAINDANNTLEIIIELCCLWKNRSDDRTITFNIAIEFENKEVLFSFAGHINDIFTLFNSNKLQFPNTESDIGSWCEELAKDLTEYFPESNDSPKLKEMLKLSGILYFDRKFIEEDHKLFWDKDQKYLGINLQISKSQPQVIKEIEKGNLQLAPMFIVKKSRCSKCDKEYVSCNCSKYSNDGVVEVMENITRVGVFWTRRKA